MPGGDGTGPWWGGGNWRCFRGARGFPGAGFGRGFGWRARFWPQYPENSPQQAQGDELAQLKAYSEELKAELAEASKRISELEKK
jgi:hypothetical protein